MESGSYLVGDVADFEDADVIALFEGDAAGSVGFDGDVVAIPGDSR